MSGKPASKNDQDVQSSGPLPPALQTISTGTNGGQRHLKAVGEDSMDSEIFHGDFEKASFGARFLAVSIDGAVFSFINQGIMMVAGFGIKSMNNPQLAASSMVITIVLSIAFSIFYYITPLTKSGSTVGRKLLKIRVVGQDGSPLTYGQGIKREFIGKIISGMVFGIGYLVALGKSKLTWHDRIASTQVVKY